AGDDICVTDCCPSVDCLAKNGVRELAHRIAPSIFITVSHQIGIISVRRGEQGRFLHPTQSGVV
ncbi:hypothetical protein CEXT_349751, partial [Caerostris extrusa]